MNRRDRRAERAEERRAAKTKALRRAAEEHLASEYLRVGGEYDPHRYEAAVREGTEYAVRSLDAVREHMRARRQAVSSYCEGEQ